MSAMQDLFGEVISSYSHAQAVEDGILINLSALAPDVCAQHFKYPVSCTAAVWAIIDKAVEHPKWHNDLNGVIHDMLGMSKVFCRRVDDTTRIFRVKITGAGRKSLFDFKIVCGPGDDAEPVMTIMLPEED